MAEETENKSKKRKGMGMMMKLIILLVSLALCVFIRQTFLFLIIALLPSVVAYLVDRSERRMAFQSVLACNLAGTMPFLSGMLKQGNSQAVVQTAMADMTTWFIIYSAAAIGWCMLWLWPHVAYFWLNMLAMKEIFRLELAQKKLLDEWGPELKRREP